MKKEYSVAIVCDRYTPYKGGIEQLSLSLSSSLPKEWKIKIITQGYGDNINLYKMYSTLSPVYSAKDPYGHPIFPLNGGLYNKIILLPLLLWNIPFIKKFFSIFLFDNLYVWYKIAFTKKLEALLKDIDTIHCISTGYLARAISEICLKRGIKLIHHPFIHFGKWGDSPEQIKAYAMADAIVCPTLKFKEVLANKIPPLISVNLVVIPPLTIRYDYPKLKMPPVPGRFILFLGRREAHKGLTTLLVAFEGLEHLASLVIAGPGKQIRVRNMAVFDLGEVDENMKAWLLSSCDLFCVPSSDESFGITFAEALSYGKPVVSFNIHPINEIVVNGECGILVPLDDTNGLHNALEKLLTDHSLRKKMGMAAKERFEKYYSQEVVMKQIIALHQS
ncbi:MAG: glycosyltransferase family 4 protein [Chitinispirillaceae bacterium]|nr:glycosyltransferase family 4 protein [Chitinispirillaceae bacterium]